MTAEPLSRHLAQSTDRSNFCAGEPPVETFNMEMTDTSQVKQNECPLCHQHHSISRCPQYLDSSIQDRKQHVQSLHICFNCLGQSHLNEDCPFSNRCFKPNIGALHHTSLHTSDSKNRHLNVKKTCPANHASS